MNNNTLQSLRDIHLPAPISIWPLAPGWYILIALITSAVLVLFYLYYRKCLYARAKKQALKKLQHLHSLYQQGHDAQLLIAQASILLRRVALAYFPRQQIAGLHGTRWLQFLDQNSPLENFARDAQALTTAPYETHSTTDFNYLFSLVKQWIEKR